MLGPQPLLPSPQCVIWAPYGSFRSADYAKSLHTKMMTSVSSARQPCDALVASLIMVRNRTLVLDHFITSEHIRSSGLFVISELSLLYSYEY